MSPTWLMTEWTLETFYCRLFHVSTSHVSHYSRPTKNSSDCLRSQSPPHKTNTKPRDKQWPRNSHYGFLRNNTLTPNTQWADRPMGSEGSTATTSCWKNKNRFLLKWSARGKFLSAGSRSIISEASHACMNMSATSDQKPHCCTETSVNRKQRYLQSYLRTQCHLPSLITLLLSDTQWRNP